MLDPYQGILAQVQRQDNNIDFNSETEGSEPPPCSIKHKEAINMLEKYLTWLQMSARVST